MTTLKCLRQIALVACALTFSAVANGAVIELHSGCLPSSCNPAEFGEFADGSARLWGQTITVPSANQVQNFSFWVATNRNAQYFPQDLVFRGLVLPWDPLSRRASGAPIFFSESVQLAVGAPFSEVSFAANGLTLNSGATYAFVIGSLGLPNPHPSSFTIADLATPVADDTDRYLGGSLVNVYATSMADLTSIAWNVESHHEMEFRVAFSDPTFPIPEPNQVTIYMIVLLSVLVIHGFSKLPRVRRQGSVT